MRLPLRYSDDEDVDEQIVLNLDSFLIVLNLDGCFNLTFHADPDVTVSCSRVQMQSRGPGRYSKRIKMAIMGSKFLWTE